MVHVTNILQSNILQYDISLTVTTRNIETVFILCWECLGIQTDLSLSGPSPDELVQALRPHPSHALHGLGLPLQPLGHHLLLQIVSQDLLAGHLRCLAILGPPHPPPGQGVFLQLRRSSIKYKDRLDPDNDNYDDDNTITEPLPPVEEQLADPVVEPQQVGVRDGILLPVPEPPDSLVEPDGDVHSQHLV